MSNENQCQWTEEICLRLIREFRQRPVLWDPKNPLFYKKRVKAAAWIEISNVLQIPPDSCSHKMVILQSSFRREKARMRKSLEPDKSPSNVYRSSWFGFEDMLFLLDKDTERNRTSMGNEDKDFEGSGEPFEEENATLPMTVHVHRKTEKHKLTRRSFMEKYGLARKKHKGYATDSGPSQQVHTQVQQQQPTTSMAPITSNNENEINFFANFIASKMMKYSETTKNAVQQAICEVIFQADQNLYEAHEDPLTPVNMADIPTSSIKISYSDDSGDSDN